MQKNQSGGTQTLQYHPELIALFTSAVPTSTISGNVIAPLLFVYAVYALVPQNLLIAWVVYSFFIALFRLFVANKLSQQTDNDTYMKLTIFTTALGGSVWGLATILVYIYTTEIYTFFTLTVVVGIVAAASTTMTPIFKAYVYYAITATAPLAAIFFLKDTNFYIITALLIVVFTLFVLIGGYKHYKKLYEAIILKDQLKVLNEDLEGEVKKRTVELEVLNNSLEDKVQEEIEKNRDKDQQLLQQSRMAQMGEMISMIAHQWRQPLGAIAASSIDLKMKIAFESFDLDKKEGQKECSKYFDGQLTNIEAYVQSLTNTIDDFRNFYKPNREKKKCSINEPIQKSLNIINAAAKANGIDIKTEYKSQKIFSIYDSELMQVFLNIIKNAQDNFIEKKIANACIMIETKDIPEGIMIIMCDNGGGIAEDIMMKVFDPYFSTKDEKNGTGLGLYMSKTIVEEHHHGKLKLTNKNGGACFTITLSEENS